MSNCEQGKCDFCGEIKILNRYYLRIKNKHFDDNKKGCYSKFISYCSDCGIDDDLVNKYKEALVWCSGSKDFQLEGIARKGWEKIVKPLL